MSRTGPDTAGPYYENAVRQGGLRLSVKGDVQVEGNGGDFCLKFGYLLRELVVIHGLVVVVVVPRREG